MINLIKKEFMIQKKYLLYYIFYGAFMLVVFSASSVSMAQTAYITTGIGVIYMFIQYSCAIEDKNKSEKILNSLPVKRKSIVLSKYAAIIIFSALTVIGIGLIGLIVSKLYFTNNEKIGLIDISTILVFSVVLSSIYLPVYFKFGYIKAKIFNLIIFLALFSGSMLMGNYLKFMDNSMIDFILSAENITIAGIATIITITLFIISAFISTKLYRSREFN